MHSLSLSLSRYIYIDECVHMMFQIFFILHFIAKMRVVVLLVLFAYHNRIIVNSMELKGTSSCQLPLVTNSKIIMSSNTDSPHMTNRSNSALTIWCPSSFDVEPYLQVSLSSLTYITRADIKSIGSNIDYHLEYTRDTLIDRYTTWRRYHSSNNLREKSSLDSPMIAKHVRLVLKPPVKNACLQLELFGCIFTDGVISYSMPQGTNRLEDDTYDGQYDEKRKYLFDGLGQLSDGKTGPDNRDDPRGFQWVGWRKFRGNKNNHPITILFTFDSPRNFSRMTIHSNNYYPQHVHVFRSVSIEFLNNEDEENSNSSIVTFNQIRDEQFEMARPVMIDLKNYVASQLKVRLYFDGNWLLISEVTFDSFVVSSPTTTTTTTTEIPSRPAPSANLTIKQEQQTQPISLWVYMVVCLSTMAIVLMLGAIIILIRRTLRESRKIQKRYFTPIHNHNHNHTDSSASTTSSVVDVGSSHHRYATIGTVHPYLVCSNGSNTSCCYLASPPPPPHYAKVLPMSTTTLLRSPSTIQQYHIEGVCGNSAFATQRMFPFDLSRSRFVPSHHVHIKRRICSGNQMTGGEICSGELQLAQSTVPITIRRLLPNASVQSCVSFYNEMSLLTSLCHPNIVHAYGFCSEPTTGLLMESPEISSVDLYHYLQHYKQEQQMGANLHATALFFGAQLTSALAYLESLHICHRDVAARNCLVTLDLTVKLQDLSMCNETYADDYVLVTVNTEDGNEIKTRRPIRWCAWETICLNRFTSKSDVFSFGVLLWEILTMAERPHGLLDDDDVLRGLRDSASTNALELPACASDLADLIQSCWHKCDYERPSFHQLDETLRQKQQQHLKTIINLDDYQQTN